MNMRLQKEIEALQPEMVASVQRLVKIRSVENLGEEGTPFGVGVQRCLDEALTIGRELGFETVNMDNMLGWCEYGSGEEMVAVLGHLDVVPEADGWAHPPYAAELVGDRIVGRGTIDDKGPVVAAMYALKAIKDAGLPLKRRVRILFGLNEETGALDMKYYLAHGGEVPVMGFTPDGEYPLINGEKGIVNEVYERPMHQTGAFRLVRVQGGVAGNVAPDHAEALVTGPAKFALPAGEKITVTPAEGGWLVAAEGVSAHGSHPEVGENAIGRLALYLKQLPFEGDAAAAIAFVADRMGMDCFGAAIGCALEDELSGKLSFNLGTIAGDENALRVKLNYRYPVTCEVSQCQPAVAKAFAQAGWNQVSSVHKPKLYIPEDSRLVQSLLKVYRADTGDNAPPKCIGGGTYAKAIPNILAFGPIFPGDEMVEHQPNEYITVEHLVKNAQICADALLELAQ